MGLRRKVARSYSAMIVIFAFAIILGSVSFSASSLPTSAIAISQSPNSTPFKYLVTIVEENQPLKADIGILGNTADAPFINGLLPQAALATNYHDTSHDGSLSQYIGMISGNNRCLDNSPNPKGGNPCQLSGNTIVDRIEASGRTWKAYMEDYKNCYTATNTTGCSPHQCFTDLYWNQGQYLGNHNPFLYFPAITGSDARCANIVAANSVPAGYTKFEAYPDLLLSDLNSANTANYNWLVPNHCDSFHGPFGLPSNWSCDPYYCSSMATNSTDCLRNQIQAGDKYLSKVVPKILNSAHFLAGEAALFITFDEPNSHPDRSPGCSNKRYVPPSSDECPILGLWIGPTVKNGFVSDTFYSHYSYLKTIESAWQLPPLTINDTYASPMTEFFKASFPTPQASFTITPTNPLVDQTVKFTSSMLDGTPPLTSVWDFGDGTPTVSGSSVTHAYGRNGTFTPKVTITDSLQLKDTSSQSLPVTLPVSASFDYSPVNLAPGIRASFVAHITGGWGEYSYSWDFGDGLTDTSSSPIHKYGDSGLYKVRLTISDILQHSVSYNKTLIVNPMAGSIFTDVAIPVAGDKITFTGTVNGGTGPYALTWNFGDGNHATGNMTVHTYTSDGVYRVRLNITDSTNLFARSARDISVSKALCAVPKACNFASNTSTPTTGQQILFKATADGGVAPYVFTWNFGDGETANGDSIQHTYLTTGTYNITITVRDSAGHTYRTSNTLTIGHSKTSDLPLNLFSPFVLVAIASGAAISSLVFWYKSRILERLRN